MSAAPPTLDLGRLTTEGLDAVEPALLDALDAACREWGFFQVVGHGVPTARQAGLDRAMRDFFAQSQTAKQAVARTADNPFGYYDRELTKNVRDWKEIFDIGPERHAQAGHNQWPRGMSHFRSATLAHYADCTRLAERLSGAIALALGGRSDALLAPFAGHSSFLRLNHYPPRPDRDTRSGPDPDEALLGVNRHTDAGALTILYQDAVPGLEVQRGDGGDPWVSVSPQPGALVVNLGDMLQIWSNDRYRAPLHRVLAPTGSDRVSAPFFYNPSYRAQVAPLPFVLGPGQKAHYPPVPWREFRDLRAAGDYADVGPEVQLAAYRIED